MSFVPSWVDYLNWLSDCVAGQNQTEAAAPRPEDLWTDSRDIKPGQWFVPIVGEAFDGHKFVETAMAKGAAGFFYSTSHQHEIPSALLPKGLAVTDTLVAFQRCALGWRRQLTQLKLLALTGSSGKTTTKEMTSAILQAAGSALATHGSFNNEIGVPKTMLQLKPEHQTAILEFGARHPGDIKFLTKLAEPNVTALLNVGTAHLGIFGSAENLLNGKLEIFRDSPDSTILVAAHDDPRILKAAIATGKKVISFGFHKEADVRVLDQTWNSDGTMGVTLQVGRDQLKLQMKIAHEAYPINAAAACAMAVAAGISLEAVKKGLEAFTGIKGRYQIHRFNNLTLIDDCYNANPESMAIGFKTVARSFKDKRKVIILGDMLELGEQSALEHEKTGHLCAEVLKPELLITVGQDARFIAAGAKKAGLNDRQLLAFSNVDELLAAAKSFKDAGDVFYVKASNGIKLSKFIDHLVDLKGML